MQDELELELELDRTAPTEEQTTKKKGSGMQDGCSEASSIDKAKATGRQGDRATGRQGDRGRERKRDWAWREREGVD